MTAFSERYGFLMDRLCSSQSPSANRTSDRSMHAGSSTVSADGSPLGVGGVAPATEGADEDDLPSDRIGLALVVPCDSDGIAIALPSRILFPHRFFAPSVPASALRRDDSRSFMNSRCIRGWCHLPSVRRVNGTITAGFASDHSSGVMRAQRARRRSSSGTLPTGSSRHALHSSSMYAPTCAMDMASTSPSEAKSSG